MNTRYLIALSNKGNVLRFKRDGHVVEKKISTEAVKLACENSEAFIQLVLKQV